MRLRFGEKAAGEVRLEPREVRFPARSGLRGERAVVEDVSEDEQAAAFVGGQHEAVPLAVEGPGEAVRCGDLGHLPGHSGGFEGLSGGGGPFGRGGEPALKLCGLADGAPHPLDGVSEPALEAQRGAPVDRLQGSVHHGLPSRCRSRSSRRSGQKAR